MLRADFLILRTCVDLIHSRKFYQFECYAGSLLAVALGCPVNEESYEGRYGYDCICHDLNGGARNN